MCHVCVCVCFFFHFHLLVLQNSLFVMTKLVAFKIGPMKCQRGGSAPLLRLLYLLLRALLLFVCLKSLEMNGLNPKAH